MNTRQRIVRTDAPRQKGMALIEALVSLLILALGVMGLLAVQVRTVTENQSSNYRQVAVRLADDLFERIKANPGGWTTASQYAVGWGNAPAANTNCTTSACTAAQKAAWDVVQWKALVTATLPAGTATAFVSPSDPRQMGVMIGWRANEASQSADYVSPFNVDVAEGGFAVTCPASLICHRAYAQP